MLVRIMWRFGLRPRWWRRRLGLPLRGGVRLLRLRGLLWVLSLGHLRRGSRCWRLLLRIRMRMLLLRQGLVRPLLLCLNLCLLSPARSIFSGR
jgi:hypothetical protein